VDSPQKKRPKSKPLVRRRPDLRPKTHESADDEVMIPVRAAMVWLWVNRGSDRMRGYGPDKRPPRAPTGEPSLTKRAFAAFWHLGKSYLYKLIKRGLPVRSDGRIDFYTGGEWLEENTVPNLHRLMVSIEDEDPRDEDGLVGHGHWPTEKKAGA
jgi:hypothetical protein